MGGRTPPGVIDNATTLRDACMGSGAVPQVDLKGKIAKSCTDPSGGFAKVLEKSCDGESLATLFPGCGESDPGATADCLNTALACRFCLATNATDHLTRNCDLFDNQVADNSCPNIDALFVHFLVRPTGCLSDGVGGLSCGEAATTAVAASDVAVGDFKSDSIPDIVMATNSGSDWTCMGSGTGTVTCGAVPGGGVVSRDVAVGDMNGDGHQDIVFAASTASRICLGSGANTWSCSTLAGISPVGVALGFVDSDNFLDIVFAGSNGADRVCLGDGTGAVSCSVITNSQTGTGAVALDDLNGDGFLDAVLANGQDQANNVCFGDGNGTLTCSFVDPGDAMDSLDVAIADLNGDGAKDIVFANNDEGAGDGQLNSACLGDGTGNFTCNAIDTIENNTEAVVIGDMNGDFLPDLLLANDSEPNAICTGDGTGAFTCTNLDTATDKSLGVALLHLN